MGENTKKDSNMFVPKSNRVDDIKEIHDFIRDHSFGILVSNSAKQLEKDFSLSGTHIPFVLQTNQGKNGVLYAHLAKANPQWRTLENQQVMVIFSGPHAYISPTWYTNPPNVPTWNYTAVHGYGEVQLLDKSELLDNLNELTKTFEPSLLLNKETMPARYIDKLSAGIVGFKIKVSRWDAQMKLGQQRSEFDQIQIYKELQKAKDLDVNQLTSYMQKILKINFL
ncbi:MAG: transcriptional regulator [Alphaproteobacteria bacterium]